MHEWMDVNVDRTLNLGLVHGNKNELLFLSVSVCTWTPWGRIELGNICTENCPGLDSRWCNEEVVAHYNNISTSWKTNLPTWRRSTVYSTYVPSTISATITITSDIAEKCRVYQLTIWRQLSAPQTYKEGDTQSIYQQLLVVDTYVYSLIHHGDHCETRIMNTKLLAVLSLLLIAGQLTGEENKKSTGTIS